MNVKRIFSIFLALAVMLGLAACGNSSGDDGTDLSGSGASAEEVFVTLTESWDFASGFYPVLTPAGSSNYGVTYWSSNFYDTLVKYEDGEIVGSLAESWKISDDGTVYTFTLRDEVYFSDGTLLTASAVKTSIEAAIQNLGMYNGSYGKLTLLITSVEAPDELTVVMTLSQPYYAALNDLSMMNPMAIVSPNAFNEDLTPSDDCSSRTMGTGPYMFEGDTDGTTYNFVRNPHYWGEEPEVDGFAIKVIEDNDAKVLALRSGEIDAILGAERLSYDAYAELSGDAAYGTAVNETVTTTRYIAFNLSAAPFDDVNVRQAVAYALDRDTLCEMVLAGIETPAENLFDKTLPYCDVDVTTYGYDVDKANQLLESAGWIDSDGDGVREKDGKTLEFTMSYMQGRGSVDDVMLAIADQLAEIGFKITPSGTDMMTWYSMMLDGSYEITFYQTYGGSFQPFASITNMNSAISTDPLLAQMSGILEGGNALILEVDSTSDLKRVQEIYTEILSVIADGAFMAPVSYTHEFSVWNGDVISSYDFSEDCLYVNVAGIHVN